MKKPGKSNKIRTVLTLLVVLILAALAVFLLIGKMQNRVIFLFGRATLWVETDSMESEIPAQSYILIRRANAGEIQLGDVITFYSSDPAIEGMLNTHRVERIAGDGVSFVTKGDHNLAEDRYPALAENIVGIYEKNLPALTAIGRFFKTPAGLAVTLALVLLVCCALYLPDVIKAFQADKQAKAARAQQAKQEEIDRLVAEEIEKLHRADKDPEDRNPPKQ